MAGTYWDSVLKRRQTRRRLLAATGASAASAAFLAACGGGDDDEADSAEPADQSGLIHTPKDSLSSAKPGGTLKHFFTADITTFDSLANNGAAPLSQSAAFVYPRLMKYSILKYPERNEGTAFEGDLASSYEVSPDKLTVTFKLRSGVKWDPRPPTSSREADSNDVLRSWEKFKSVNPGASTYVYNAATAPSAPVESMTAPDSKTIVVKLKEPDASIVALFAGTTFSPMPKEFEGGFDPKTTTRGHGPWMLDAYTPSVGFTFVKNPNYYVSGRPFPDRLEAPIVPEYATRLAQFRAGNIHTDVTGGFGGNQADIVPTKNALPETQLLVADSYPTQAPWHLMFGWDGVAPFKDKRMRQAVSMLIDREGVIDALDNRDGFAKDGLELDVAYNTVVSAGWSAHWLDPKNQKDFGASAKYLSHDPAEAKKLLEAANGVGAEFDFHYNSSPQFPIQARVVELYNAMFLEAGLKPKLHGVNNAQEYQDNYYYGYRSKDYAAGTKKGYGGIAAGSERPFATLGLMVHGTLHKDGAFYHGMSPTGTNLQDGDPKVNDFAMKIKQEYATDKQVSLTHDLIRYFTDQSYYIPQVSAAKGFTLWWPIGNLGVYSNGVSPNLWTERHLHWWVDATKKPFGA
ncbi:MAG TPA: ABC transporter substrate-binding protein [Dehalococcoidia bacterium]